MEKLKAVWDWFDGKKTTIGGAFVLAAKVAPVLGADPQLVAVLDHVGTYFIGAGLAHKTIKLAQ